jgi:Dyp-type peroxidase family
MSLVLTVNAGRAPEAAVRALCGDLAGLLRAVGFRDLEGRLSCVMAFGSDAWARLFGAPRPKELHPFREIRGQHHAVATPGDILFHIRAMRMDLCFELATQIMSRLGGAVSTADEVHGFSTSTIATCSVSSMAWRIPRTRRPSTPPSSARRTRHSPAGVTRSCRSTSTT